MSEHICHAEGCEVGVPPKLLFCLKHWRMTPARIKAAVWREYRAGQEMTKTPTPEYLAVMAAAIEAVAKLEGRR